MREREALKTELLEMARSRVLRGIHGPLPKNAIPVPTLDLTEGCPISWRKSFARYGAKGKPGFWHGIMEEYSEGAVQEAMDRWPDTPRGERRLFFLRFDDDVAKALQGLPLGPKIVDRISGDTPSLFTIILVWMLLDRPKNDFFARLLYQSYCAGGAPCGWLGKFPKGHLIVYWPYKQDPQFE